MLLPRLLLSMAAVVSAADECSAPAGQLAGRLVVITGASRGVAAAASDAVTGQSLSVDGGLTMP